MSNPDETLDHDADAQEPLMPFTLRITEGLHAGARQALERDALLVVGSSPDCDLVLADEGVSERHCMLSCAGRRMILRVLDGEVAVDGERVTHADRIALAAGSTLRLGGAALALQGAGDDEPRGCAGDASARGTLPASGRGHLSAGHWLAVGLVLLGLTTIAFALPMGSGGVDRQLAEQASVDAAQAGSAAGPDAPSDTSQRKGSAIASDVHEVLRLSGIRAEAEHIGDGRVRVRGYLGPEERLREVIQSRSMRTIPGLDQVVAVNYDAGDPAPARGSPRPEPSPVASVVAGEDPYLILEDGSRIYTGAELPGGGVFVDIDGDRVVIEQDDREYKASAVGRSLEQIGNS